MSSRRFYGPLFLVVVLCLHASVARANTYRLDDTWGVACLDLATGHEIFEVQPGSLRRPRIEAGHGFVRVTDDRGRRYELDALSGKPLESSPPSDAPVVGRIEPLRTNLTSDGGRTLEFRDGYTHGLQYRRSDDSLRVIRELDYIHGLHVYGNLALFTYAGGTSGIDVEGGVVHALDVFSGKEVWTYRAIEHHASVQPADWTGIDLDGDRALVTVSQVVHVVDARTGKGLATWPLPRQAIRDWDNAWTEIARLGDRYFVQCYEDLFVLDVHGAISWSFDPGEFAHPWPTVSGSRVYVETRRGTSRSPAASVTTMPTARTRVDAQRPRERPPR